MIVMVLGSSTVRSSLTISRSLAVRGRTVGIMMIGVLYNTSRRWRRSLLATADSKHSCCRNEKDCKKLRSIHGSPWRASPTPANTIILEMQRGPKPPPPLWNSVALRVMLRPQRHLLRHIRLEKDIHHRIEPKVNHQPEDRYQQRLPPRIQIQS